jgi:hypothetical protein
MEYQDSDAQLEPSADQQQPEGDNSRRTFLKAAVAASAAVAVAGGAAGFAIATGKVRAPFLSFVGQVASGVCMDLKQGGKFGPSNPNNFLQLDDTYLDAFGTAASTKDSNKNFPLTFTRCGTHHSIHFTLTDKTNSNFVISGTLVETGGDGGNYSYEGGDKVLYLAYIDVVGGGPDPSASLNNQFPAGSCLTVNCV